jgi:hypothetical protein
LAAKQSAGTSCGCVCAWFVWRHFPSRTCRLLSTEVVAVTMKWEGCERKRLFSVLWLWQNLCFWGTDENHKIAQSGYISFRPSIEPLTLFNFLVVDGGCVYDAPIGHETAALEKTEVSGEKTAPLSLCPPQIPHELPLEWKLIRPSWSYSAGLFYICCVTADWVLLGQYCPSICCISVTDTIWAGALLMEVKRVNKKRTAEDVWNENSS